MLKTILSCRDLLFGMLFGMLFVSTLAIALEGNWKTVGSVQVRGTGQMAAIPVLKSAQEKTINAVRFHAAKGDIKIRSAKLILSDGNTITLSIQKLIRSGLNSRIIPIKTNGRAIKKVTIFYEVKQAERARIDLMAEILPEE